MSRAGRRPGEDQPAPAGRARHRPLGPGRRVGTADAFATQRRARVRAQPRALRVPALGPGRVRELHGRPARHRHRPPGQPRVPRPRRLRRRRATARASVAYPDTLVGTDSHTTMINGLGVLGWGVGGIEAEAAMLGQPVSMLIPQVVGFKLARRAARGRDRDRPRAHRHRDAPPARASSASSSSSTATAWPTLPLADRATIANMAPSTARPAASSRSTPRRSATSSSPGRPAELDRAGRGLRQGAGPVPRRGDAEAPTFSDTLELDLGDGRAEPGRPEAAAGPRRRSPTPRRRSARRCRATLDADGADADARRPAFPASDPPRDDDRRPRTARPASERASTPRAGGRRPEAPSASRRPTARRSRSTTAPS